MLREEIVEVPMVKAHTKTVEIYGCDFCMRENKDRRLFRACVSCNRLCCWQWLKDNHARQDSSGRTDYPDYYCPICYDLLFDKYAKTIENIEEEAYNRKEEILEKIKQESLAQQPAMSKV